MPLLESWLAFVFMSWYAKAIFAYFFSYPLDTLSTAAGVIELIAGALIIVGFYSRFAAFISSGTMAVGYWLVHGLNDPFPIANGGEIAAFYAFAFLYGKGQVFGQLIKSKLSV